MSTDIQGWEILLHGGRNYLGRPVGVPGLQTTTYSPIFELVVQPTPQGVVRVVIPVLLMDVKSLSFPSDTPRVEVNSLPRDDRQQLVKCVEDGEQVLQQLRARSSGIVLAAPGQVPSSPLIRGK